MALGNYSFDQYRSRAKDKRHRVRRVTVVELDKAKFPVVRVSVARGRAIGEAACFTRDLCNSPSLDLTPRAFAERAKELASAKNGISVTVLDEKQIKQHKMGCFLGVAKGEKIPMGELQAAIKDMEGRRDKDPSLLAALRLAKRFKQPGGI